MDPGLQFLEKLYSKLKECYLRGNNGKCPQSLLFALLDYKSSTRRMRLLIDAAVLTKIEKPEILDQLSRLGLIQFIDVKRSVTFTAKGIWQIEKELKVIDADVLIDFIDKKWFDCFKKESQALSDKEKVILFTALAARAFSEQSSIDLTKKDKIHDAWKETVEKVVDFLFANKIIADPSLRQSLFVGKKSGKTTLHPVVYCFRYSADIPQKVNGLFVAKNSRYFLNIYRDEKIAIEELSFLFELVLGDNFGSDLLDKVFKFCQEISYEKSIVVFSVDKHNFAQPDYDDLIRASLQKVLLNI